MQELTIIFGAVGAVGVICSASLGIALYRRNKRQDTQATVAAVRQECATDTNLANDVKYIVRSVDAIKDEQRGLRQDITGIKDAMSDVKERLARVDESAKSAHRRIDELLAKQ